MASWINRRLPEFRSLIYLSVAIFIQPSQGNIAARCNKMNNVILYFKVASVTNLAKFVVESVG